MFDINKKVKKTSKKKYNKEYSNTIIIVISITLIIFLICYSFIKSQSKDYNNIKIIRNNNIVYTKYNNNSDKYNQQIPYLNIKGESASAINNNIDEYLKNIKNEEKAIINYEYNVSGKILSLILKVVNYNTNYAPEVYFRSYILNIDTLEILSEEDIFKLFGVDSNYIENKIEDKFKNYYKDILKEKYYNKEECNYNCFLKYRGFSDYLENVEYYIRDGSLYVFKPFTFVSIFGEEEYFDDDDFEIFII